MTTTENPTYQLVQSYRSFQKQFPERMQTEELILTQFEEFILSQPEEQSSSRSNSLGHITASAWLINPTWSEVFLGYHRKLERWAQFGGHLEPIDQTVLDASLREAHEESGLSELKLLRAAPFHLEIYKVPTRPHEAAHQHFDITFLFVCQDLIPQSTTNEHLDRSWVGFDNILSFIQERSLLTMVQKTRYLRQSLFQP